MSQLDGMVFSNLIEDYSQIRYDFNPKALSRREINEIKTLAREKRVEYGIAPIGKNIFDFITSNEKNIYFEKQAFDNKELDGMIFVPSKSRNIAFIILNSNQPLLNQIFATAHEYYHFLTDIELISKNPHICSLSHLGEKSEQKASRFAAEFLLPDDALRKEINNWLSIINKQEVEDAEIEDITILCYILTTKFCLPLKAILYRLFEEGYIESKMFDLLISNYEFIKDTFIKAKNVYKREIEELLSNENPYIHEVMYEMVPKAFRNGFVSIDTLQRDAKLLNLDIERFGIDEMQEDLEDENEDDDDELMFLKDKLIVKLNLGRENLDDDLK
jgi:Zn-dependent peptidase ImmA (M78 family)